MNEAGRGAWRFDAVAPADQAAGLDEAGLFQRIEGEQNPRAEGGAGREPVWLVREDRRDGEGGAADGEAVAKADAQPVENAAVNRKSVLAHNRAKASAFLEAHGSVKRIGAIHGLEVHERLLAAIRLAGHRA